MENKLEKISLFGLEWNGWNGFTFEILAIEYGNFCKDLFSIRINSGLQIELFFIKFDIS